ncbi:AbrB family transcriptional regulator [Bifidobacterium thermophilum]|uniref:AbrB family transcriptional regulator n=1 Tax=Bifidobacterium thermophilum TaxID=33905 RepID=A0A7X9NP83_9BIFI|nr:AbrB family transcriptional regulator [Bifidobacterium thermophilum]NME61283.1 AbrB family transcriptional regulator [Bifidobacterium thermophilum]
MSDGMSETTASQHEEATAASREGQLQEEQSQDGQLQHQQSEGGLVAEAPNTVASDTDAPDTDAPDVNVSETDTDTSDAGTPASDASDTGTPDSATPGESATPDTAAASFEPLTVTYERLRHTDDVAELHEYARRPLPDRSLQAAFSRATALLEAVAGNQHTPLEDRVFLATEMPFPNILVKLSEDPEPQVRRGVAANQDDKNWLVGRLTKDPDPSVRDAALRNPRTSWKMRLEGAQNPEVDADTLDFLSTLGVSCEPGAPVVLAGMVRRAVALNPQASQETLQRLSADTSPSVARCAQRRLEAAQTGESD